MGNMTVYMWHFRQYRRHLARKRVISQRKPSAESVAWARRYRQGLVDRERQRQDKAEGGSRE